MHVDYMYHSVSHFSNKRQTLWSEHFLLLLGFRFMFLLGFRLSGEVLVRHRPFLHLPSIIIPYYYNSVLKW